jgi:GntR family transcriptional repressor for pyruvate dehydrogenase complex
MLEPVGRSGTITEAITAQLAHLIMNGHYKSGDRLPPEFELAKQFRASRGAVREALKSLSLIDIIRVERGIGTFVGEPAHFLTRPLVLGLTAHRELRQLIEARKFMEVELAGLAADRADASQILSIEACLNRMSKLLKVEQPEEYIQADLSFHFAIADAARNTVLEQLLGLIRNVMQEWMRESLRAPGAAVEALSHHKRILKAIQERKPSRARKAMERHLIAMWAHLQLAKAPVNNGSEA